MIKAIIFDADGPLYQHAGNTEQEQRLLRKYGYHGSYDDFKSAYEKEKWKSYIAQETPQKMFRNILTSIGLYVSDAEAKLFAANFDPVHEQVEAAPDARTILKTLKEVGYLTCVLTDSFYSAGTKWQWFERIGLKPYLDCLISSWDIGKLKNSPEAFQACLDKLDVSADEALFVGHQQYEMDGAKAARIGSVAILPIATPNIQADYLIRTLPELSQLLARLAEDDKS